jgi:hypothetical protein
MIWHDRYFRSITAMSLKIFFINTSIAICLFACLQDSNTITGEDREERSHTFYVSPSGSNDSTINGSALAPFGSVTYGLQYIADSGLDSAQLILYPGRYSTSLTGEQFPLYLTNNLKIMAQVRFQTVIDMEGQRPLMLISRNDNILIRGILFENGQGLGISVVNSTTVHIDSCIFINFYPGFASPTVVIQMSDLGECVLTNNILVNNTELAIEIGPMYGDIVPKLYKNRISNNKAGIDIKYSPALIGTELNLANDIYDNFDYNLRVFNTNDNDVVDARYNYWGSTDIAVIASTISGTEEWIPFTDSTHTSSISD